MNNTGQRFALCILLYHYASTACVTGGIILPDCPCLSDASHIFCALSQLNSFTDFNQVWRDSSLYEVYTNWLDFGGCAVKGQGHPESTLKVFCALSRLNGFTDFPQVWRDGVLWSVDITIRFWRSWGQRLRLHSFILSCKGKTLPLIICTNKAHPLCQVQLYYWWPLPRRGTIWPACRHFLLFGLLYTFLCFGDLILHPEAHCV